MISDTLHDARVDIKRYLNDPVFAPCYSEPRIQLLIKALLHHMRSVQTILDTCPTMADLGMQPRVPETPSSSATPKENH